MTYIKKSKSLPLLNENNLFSSGDEIFETRKRSKSCSDLRKDIKYYSDIMQSSTEEKISNAETYSKEKQERLSHIINECYIKINNTSRKLANISNCISDINEYYLSHKDKISDAEKIKYLRKITELRPKKTEEQRKQNEARRELINLENSFFENKNENEKKFLNTCISGNIEIFEDLINNLQLDNDENENENNDQINQKTISDGFEAACLCGNIDIVKNILKQDELKNIILNDNKNFKYLKGIYSNKDTNIFKILINDDDIRKKLVEKEDISTNQSILFFFINDSSICPFDKIEEINTLFSYPEIANVIINNKYFKRDFNGFFALGAKEIIKKVFSNNSITKNIVEKYGILLYIKFALENKQLETIKTMFENDNVRKTILESSLLLTKFKSAIFNNDFPTIKELLEKDTLIVELFRTDNFSKPFRTNVEKLNSLIFDKNINSNRKTILKKKIINNTLKLLRQNRNQEKENILETLKNNVLSQVFEEASKQKDTKLIKILFNDAKIVEEITSNDEKLDEHFKKIFIMSDLETIELLVKNDINFKKELNGYINLIVNNKEDFYKIKNNFNKLCKKYSINYSEEKLFHKTKDCRYVINLKKINEKLAEISNEIKKQDELLGIIKNIVEKYEPTKENNINNKIISINSKVEVLKNLNKECKKQVNINKNKQLCKSCLPAIKDSKNKNIFEEGFGGSTTFDKNNIKIKFNKDGFLRKTLENNSETDKSILNILKNSLIIEHGKTWNNSNKIELDTILMLFKKDPNIAFKMLIKLEEDKKIIIKKKGFLFNKKLSSEEKVNLQKVFEEVVENRQEISNIISIKERILNNNYISGETRETIEKITDFGIKIIKYNKKDIIGNKKFDININNIKQKNINNIIDFLSFIENNEDKIKNNENKISKILKNINNSIKAIDNNNKEDMIVALNNCIINLDNYNKNISVLQQAQ